MKSGNIAPQTFHRYFTKVFQGLKKSSRYHVISSLAKFPCHDRTTGTHFPLWCLQQKRLGMVKSLRSRPPIGKAGESFDVVDQGSAARSHGALEVCPPWVSQLCEKSRFPPIRLTSSYARPPELQIPAAFAFLSSTNPSSADVVILAPHTSISGEF